MYYRISGPGVTDPPIGLFTVDPQSGMVKVHRPVDREEYDQYIVSAKASSLCVCVSVAACSPYFAMADG